MTTDTLSHPSDAVCIVGMGCVLPGAATVDDFWHNVLSARSAIAEVPEERWNPAIHYHADRAAPDKTYSCQGGFIDNILLQTLAQSLEVDWNSHHRLMIMALEACRQALAEFEPETIRAQKTDLILGCMAADESIHLRQLHRDTRDTLERLKTQQPPQWEQAMAIIEDYFAEHLRTGIPEQQTILTTAVLHALKQHHELSGEAALIDAACASSLAAIDIAATRLRERRCDLAVTGGLEGDLGASTFVLFSKVGALAAGPCYPFDARTNGLVQGEGAVIFVLQRLQDALVQRRRIYGIVSACGAASDGRSASLFAPTAAGQKLAFQRAYQQAGPKSPDYIECHGTGTQLGDATELSSLSEFFPQTPLYIGSVKALIGHTKGAAGAAGLLKAVLAMQHRMIPPSPYFFKPLKALQNIIVNTEPLPLCLSTGIEQPALRFGVSAFGFGNINYHLVLDEFNGEPPTVIHMPPVQTDEVVVVSSVDVSEIDVEAYLAKARVNISPNSLSQTDRRQLLAVAGTLEVFNTAGIPLHQIDCDRDNVCVIAASVLYLPSAQAFCNRVNYDDLLARLDSLNAETVELVRQRKERFAPVSEDTGPGILNNVIAGKVCNVFDFKGKNFNVDADFMSIPVALELAASELRHNASLALVLCSEERLDEADMALRRDRFFCLLLTTRQRAQHQAYPILGVLDHVSYQESVH